jgi:hypothetical protein
VTKEQVLMGHATDQPPGGPTPAPFEQTAYRVTLANGRQVINLTGPDEAPGNSNEEVRGYQHPSGTGFVVTSDDPAVQA